MKVCKHRNKDIATWCEGGNENTTKSWNKVTCIECLKKAEFGYNIQAVIREAAKSQRLLLERNKERGIS